MLFLAINSGFLRGKTSRGEARGLWPEIICVRHTPVVTAQML